MGVVKLASARTNVRTAGLSPRKEKTVSENKSFEFEMGSKVKDKVSGMRGVVIGRADYISGCNQYLMQPDATKQQVKDNTKSDSMWFDGPRLESVPGKKLVVDTREHRTGADGVAPTK